MSVSALSTLTDLRAISFNVPGSACALRNDREKVSHSEGGTRHLAFYKADINSVTQTRSTAAKIASGDAMGQ